MTPSPLVQNQVREKDFQSNVIHVAHLNGWVVYHTHDSRRSEPGYPDLTLVHPDGRLLFRELKGPRGRLTKPQQMWLELLGNAGVDVGVWRPDEMPAIVEELRRKR